MSITRPSTASNGAAVTSPLTTAAPSPTAAETQPPPTPTTSPAPETTLSDRDLDKVEFFKTYDVMTGVRIAATLGGFFSLMIFLVIYKSKCSRGSKSAASDAAIAAAAAELDAVSELPYDGAFCSPRISLGNMSAPAATLRTRYSNSSYVNMLNYEQKSLPGSVMSWASRGSHQWSEPPFRQRCSLDANANTSRNSSFLMVPGVRLSSTGSSSDSSYYLEHRSLMELGLPPLVFAPSGRFKDQVESGRHVPAAETLNCAININVIQPTPDISPCSSEMQLHRKQLQRRALKLAAPLASCGSATLTEPLDDARSIGSDSVFFNNDDYWTGSDDATLCDSCSEDASSENSSADGGATAAADACSCCASESPPAHSWTSSATPSPSAAAGDFTQGPNVVQCSNQAAAPPSRVENFTSSTRELSSHSNKMTEVTSSLVLDQLGNKVDGNNELITETVF